MGKYLRSNRVSDARGAFEKRISSRFITCFISKLQAKLLEHYLMFLFLPLLFLLNINLFLQAVLSALLKFSHLDSENCWVRILWIVLIFHDQHCQKVHYIHQEKSRPSLPSLTTQKLSENTLS